MIKNIKNKLKENITGFDLYTIGVIVFMIITILSIIGCYKSCQ